MESVSTKVYVKVQNKQSKCLSKVAITCKTPQASPVTSCGDSLPCPCSDPIQLINVSFVSFLTIIPSLLLDTKPQQQKWPTHPTPPTQAASPPPPTQPKTSSNRKPSASCTCPISASDAPKLLSRVKVVVVLAHRREAIAGMLLFFLCATRYGYVRMETDGPSTVSRLPKQAQVISRTAKRA
jgi:hypothetical protein